MKRRVSGFTLVEAMVSVAIISIGFAGLYATTSASMSALNNSTTRSQLDHLAVMVLNDVETDITNISDYYSATEGTAGAPIDLYGDLIPPTNPDDISPCPDRSVPVGATVMQQNWVRWYTHACNNILGPQSAGDVLLSVTTICSPDLEDGLAGDCPTLDPFEANVTTTRRSAILTLTIARDSGAFVARRLVDVRQ